MLLSIRKIPHVEVHTQCILFIKESLIKPLESVNCIITNHFSTYPNKLSSAKMCACNEPQSKCTRHSGSGLYFKTLPVDGRLSPLIKYSDLVQHFSSKINPIIITHKKSFCHQIRSLNTKTTYIIC